MKRFIIAALLVVSSAVLSRPQHLTPRAPQITDTERQAELARRRAAVAAKMSDNSVLILLSAEPKLYTNDVVYVFRQENNLYYLTNLKQKAGTLVISKKAGKISETIYIPRREPTAETWNGHMYSNEEAAGISGIRDVVNKEKLNTFLASLKSQKPEPTVYLLLATGDENAGREYAQEIALSKSLAGLKVIDAGPIFNALRQIKSPYEIALLQHAIDITTEAQMRAWLASMNSAMEYEVQAEVEYTFRRRNADFWGYPSIVGCGPNATTLHYEESQGPVTKGQLILMDVGAEYDHLTADVTRTFPVSGKFTKEQADIYQIVYDAQEAAARAAKPGATMFDVNEAAEEVLKEGLFRLGLTAERDSEQFRVWYMHGVGHWLGMNVHDVSTTETLAPGMTFTNEPGIYIRADALDNLRDTPGNHAFKDKVRTAFEKYKNIGVRIEDDMLVTPNGVEWMTKRLPRKMSEIEAFMNSNKLSH